MKIIDCIQGSEKWYELRCGKVTASCFGHVLAGGKGATRRQYMIKLVAERMTGQHEMGYNNKFMEKGSETEPFAREYYELINDCSVDQIGFCELNENVGASTDGLVGDDGVLEVKCPLASTHIKTILSGKMDTTYIPQVQGSLYVTGRQWCDFVSYVPTMKIKPYWRKRIYRDEEYIKLLADEIGKFIDQLLDMEKQITISPF